MSQRIRDLWISKSAATPKQAGLIALLLGLCISSPDRVLAQGVSPGIDPRQLERLDQPRQTADRAQRAPMQLPKFGAATANIDTTPITTLRVATVSGLRAVPEGIIARAWRPYLGQRVSQADLVKIADEIGRVYRGAGYYLSRAIVPAQDVQSGEVRFEVIEGNVSEVVVDGADAQALGVQAMLASLSAEAPARIATLERKLALLGERPGVQLLDTSIDEITPMSGMFRLTVKVKTWRIYTSTDLDNFGSKAVGPWQSFSTAAFNSYGLPGDVLTANVSSKPLHPSELVLGRVSYDAPVGTDGFKLGATALHSEVRPDDWRRGFGVVTRTDSVELRGSFAPIKSQRTSLVVTTSFSAADSHEHDIFGVYYQDRVRSVNLAADYRLQDDLGGTNYLTVIGKRGLSAFGATPFGDPWSSRTEASPNVNILDAWYTRYQTVTDALSIKLALGGQLASGPLLNWQQFYLGGASFGRGYSNGEISGDNGIGGSFELRFDGTTKSALLKSYQLYGFADGGAVWNSGYTIRDGLQLASAGGGIRLNLPGTLRADLGFAVPLAYRSPDNEARSVRFQMSVSNSFKFCPGGSGGWTCG